MAEITQTTRVDAHSQPQLRFAITRPGLLEGFAGELRRAFVAAYEDNCFGIAKGAAYSFLLSLFPVLTTLTLVLIQIDAQSIVTVIAGFAREIVPPGTEDFFLSRMRERAVKPISFSVAAVLVALWAGSGAMISLMEGFQAAYRIPSGRPFLRQRAMAVFLVVIAAAPAVAASSLIIFGNRIESAFIAWVGIADLSLPVELTWRLARYILAFCTTTFVTGLLYFFGPNHRPEPGGLKDTAGSRFVRVWPGAITATVLWLVATAAFAWYVHHLANYNIYYGSIGTVIVLIIWLYLLACIALIGCEFNAERERTNCLITPVQLV